MIKDIGIGVALGIASTVFLTLSLSGGGGNPGNVNAFQAMSLMTLSVVPLFISGLGWGLIGGFISVATGAIAAALIIAPLFSLTYVLTCGLPVLVIVRQALLWRQEDEKIAWYPSSNLMVIWVFVSIALSCLAIVLLYMNEEFRNALIVQFDQIVPMLQKQGEAFKTLTAEKIVWLMPQFFGPFWAIVLLIGGVLAQGVLVRFKKNSRPSPVFQDVRQPKWLAFATIAIFVINTFSNFADVILGSAMLTLVLAFFLQGMAIIHKVSKEWNYRSAILAAVYLIMILMFWPVLVIALLGLVDSWVGFRDRISSTTQPGG